MGIQPPTEERRVSKDCVDEVDNNSNFVFSSFHDLNLFLILELEKELMRAWKKLYDRHGLPQESKE